MTDSRLRNLERRWRDSGSLADEAAYLLERVRAGELQRDQLELAAYCGYVAAAMAIREAAPPPPDDVVSWVEGFDRWGKPTYVRVAIAMADAALPSFTHPEGRALLERAVVAAKDWIRCPCEHHEAAAQQAHHESSEIFYTEGLGATSPETISAAKAATYAAAEAGMSGDGDRHSLWPALVAEDLQAIYGADWVRSAVARTVSPWALSQVRPP